MNDLAKPRYVPVADNALLIEFATDISDAVSDLVVGAQLAITAAEIEGIEEIVPAFVNLLVVFDPVVADHDTVQSSVETALGSSLAERSPGRRHVVQVCYDPSLGIDLVSVAEQCAMSTEAIIATHLAADYRVCMYGFAPGYAYMSGVAAEIQVPRKQAVVRGVSAGSVIIAGPQCLITTLEMPTGWSIIGRSPTQVLQTDLDAPVLFDLGDRVRFERIDIDEFRRMEAER